MNGVARYFTIDDLKGFTRAERDFTKWSEGTFRLQALMDAEVNRIREYARGGDPQGEYDGDKDRDASIAFGLVEPDLHAHDDLDAAVAIVRKIPLGLRTQLGQAVTQLTFGDPKASIFASFFDAAGSPAAKEAMTSSTSSSAS